jgi:Flp pilus assembly protein TadG
VTGSRRAVRERGAAVVDFVLVGALLTVLFVALLQFAFVLHVRNVLIDCATEGARYGALADRDADAGAQRARELITADLSAGYARDVEASVVTQDGLALVEVRVSAPLPVAGLLGVGRTIAVSGHSVVEG